jgi:hypothetical protein
MSAAVSSCVRIASVIRDFSPAFTCTVVFEYCYSRTYSIYSAGMDDIESLLYNIRLGGIIYLPMLAGGAKSMRVMIREY